MIKGINYCSFKGGLEGKCSVETALKEAFLYNYKALELNFSHDGVINPHLSFNDCKKINNLISHSDVLVNSCTSGMSWAFNPTSLDKTIRNKSIELHKKAIICSANIGATSFLFVPGVVNSPISPDSVPYTQAVNYAAEAIEKLLPIAEEHNVELCIENVWNGLFLSPVELRDFINGFSSKYLGCYFDVGNVLGYHQDPADWIKTLGSTIKRVQIKDFKKSIGNINGFCDLLAGDVPWKDVMSALYDIKYNSTIIAEMIPWDLGVLQRTSVAMDIILDLLKK